MGETGWGIHGPRRGRSALEGGRGSRVGRVGGVKGVGRNRIRGGKGCFFQGKKKRGRRRGKKHQSRRLGGKKNHTF